MEYQLRPYIASDYEFVYYVKKLVYKAYVEENWGEWNEEKQREMFAEFISNYSADINIIVIEGKMAGFFHGNDISEDVFEIGNICILPAFQGKGIGSSILKMLINVHAGQDICLRFFKQNPVVNLYKKLGFEIIEELQHDYKMLLKNK